ENEATGEGLDHDCGRHFALCFGTDFSGNPKQPCRWRAARLIVNSVLCIQLVTGYRELCTGINYFIDWLPGTAKAYHIPDSAHGTAPFILHLYNGTKG